MSLIGAKAAASEETVTIGSGERERTVRLRVFPGDNLVTVATVGERPRFLGMVSSLNSRPQFQVEHEFAPEFTAQERREVREAADKAYRAEMKALAKPSKPAGPPLVPPGGVTRYFTVDDLKLAFTPDIANRSVSIHTGIGTPRFVGQVLGIDDTDDDKSVLWFKDLWSARFDLPGPSQDIKEAAGNVWRAAREAQAVRGAPHG
jgi:hypothetical protein